MIPLTPFPVQSTPALVRPAAPLSAAEKSVMGAVKREIIRSVCTDLTAPAMEGRGSGQPGGEKAARYLADRLKAMGLSPLTGTDYLLPVPLTVSELSVATLSVGGRALALRTDFVPMPSRGAASGETKVDAPVVFVVPSTTGDDPLGGVAVNGKAVVLLAGKPDSIDANQWRDRVQAAVQAVAAGGTAATLIADADGAGILPPLSTLAGFALRRQVSLARPGGAPAPGGNTTAAAPAPIVALSASGLDALARGANVDLAAMRAAAAGGKGASKDSASRLTLTLNSRRGPITGYNVAAKIDGADPKLKGEAVLFTAHYDAFGKTADGTLFPGAADNALGVAEMLAIAQALAKAKPARTVIVLAVTGEEYGLLGARHWSQNPTWPLEKIAANINFDGIGTEVYGPVAQVTGFGREFSTLGTVFEGALSSLNLAAAPDPFPEERAFTRSDHFALVRAGVPALMLLGLPAGDLSAIGNRARKWMASGDYHQPGDTIRPDWDWSGPETLARAGALIALRVANAPIAPTWLPTSPYQRR